MPHAKDPLGKQIALEQNAPKDQRDSRASMRGLRVGTHGLEPLRKRDLSKTFHYVENLSTSTLKRKPLFWANLQPNFGRFLGQKQEFVLSEETWFSLLSWKLRWREQISSGQLLLGSKFDLRFWLQTRPHATSAIVYRRHLVFLGAQLLNVLPKVPNNRAHITSQAHISESMTLILRSADKLSTHFCPQMKQTLPFWARCWCELNFVCVPMTLSLPWPGWPTSLACRSGVQAKAPGTARWLWNVKKDHAWTKKTPWILLSNLKCEHSTQITLKPLLLDFLVLIIECFRERPQGGQQLVSIPKTCHPVRPPSLMSASGSVPKGATTFPHFLRLATPSVRKTQRGSTGGGRTPQGAPQAS